jgi:hypothetical protein
MTNVLPLKPKQAVIPCVERNVYGRRLIYVTDDNISRLISALTNKTTLNESDLEALRRLGFDVQLTRLPA